jgi:hypothetical protein
LRSSPSSVSQILRQSKKFLYETTLKLVSGLFSHQNELNMNQKTPCLQMLSWKLHVRMSMSPRKSPFIVFITPSIPNKNGGDRLRKMSISSIFDDEILENCRFWEVQTSGFGLCIIYPNYLSCFKVVSEPGQRNWTISCHRVRPICSTTMQVHMRLSIMKGLHQRVGVCMSN